MANLHQRKGWEEDGAGKMKKKWRAFKEAREFVQSLKLKNRNEWDKYCKSGKRPNDIPGGPEKSYKK